MNRFNALNQAQTQTDAGLAQHMRQVFNYMAGGVTLSGLVAYLTISMPGLLQVAINPVTQIMFFVFWLGSGFFLHRIVFSLQPAQALGAFAVFSAITGFALAPIALVYTGSSIAVAFFTAAGMFAGASLYGYISNKSLSGWGNFLMMGLWGLLAAVLINVVLSLFGVSTGPLGMIISLIAVPLFAGLTAYETNQLKEVYYELRDDELNRSRTAILGATSLYVNFVVMFIHLLNLLGVARGQE